MTNPSEGQARITVRIGWDRVNGDFDSVVEGSDAEVAVMVYERETGDVLYANDAYDPEVCSDCTDGRGWDVFAVDGDSTEGWVQRCDNCHRFDSDDDAAKAASIATGLPIGYGLTMTDRLDEDVTVRDHPRPFLVGWFTRTPAGEL